MVLASTPPYGVTSYTLRTADLETSELKTSYLFSILLPLYTNAEKQRSEKAVHTAVLFRKEWMESFGSHSKIQKGFCNPVRFSAPGGECPLLTFCSPQPYH